MNEDNPERKKLLEKINKIPYASGCYIFKNKWHEIIYIGKSKSLKKRVKHYFTRIDLKEGKYLQLSKEIYDIDVIETKTETDALILECKLIKTHRPKYNAQLKKTGNYAYLKINTKQSYPSITLSKRVQNDNWKYFGCFYNENDVYNAIELINRIWKTPLCCKESFDGHKEPCLNFHLNKCCAPCKNLIDFNTYNVKIKEIIRCLNGNSKSIELRLAKEMKYYSKQLNFEKAAYIRDSIEALEKLQRRIRKHNTILDNNDVFLFFRAFQEECFSLFFIKNGLTLKSVCFKNNYEINKEHLSDFIDADCVDGQSNEDGRFMTTCLLDIYADKLFVNIPKGFKKEKVIELLEKEFIEYVK